MFSEVFHSFLFAQVLGLYLIIMAIIMLSRVQFYRQFVMNLKASSGAVIVAASFALLFGLFMVDIHNIWVLEPRLIITLLGWFIVIKSILWLSIPEKMSSFSKRLFAGAGYYVVVVIVAIIGIFLATKGFYLFMLP